MPAPVDAPPLKAAPAPSCAAPAPGRSSSARFPGGVVIAGNANVGKSVIFHLLTGRYAQVSNFPGTTVMVSSGAMALEGATVRVYDTPGLNSLRASSEDELASRELLLAGRHLVVQVADAKNLLRAVTLALELAEADLRCVLDLNMADEARQRRLRIDATALEALLGVPVVLTVATERAGVPQLRRLIPRARTGHARVRYPAPIAQAVERITELLPPELSARRARALLWLAADRHACEDLAARLTAAQTEQMTRVRQQAQARLPQPLGVAISQAQLREAQHVADQVLVREAQVATGALDRLGAWAMHPWLGPVVLAGVLAAMYWLVGDVAAQRGVKLLEETVFGRWITPALRSAVAAAVPWAWLRGLLTGPYGLLTMALPYAFAIILPIVGMFFLCFGFLEDVGYLPRLAVMAHRGCRLLGLNGKAVLPLVLGLGCDTMATMTARILESRRDRVLVTLLLALGIPCSAQLGVIMAMLAGHPAALAVWAAVVLAVVVVVGQAAARLLPGSPSPFLYEIPPLRMPQLSNVLAKTLGRLEWYLKEAVPLFFLGTLVLYVLDALGALRILERLAAPLVTGWLGLPAPATSAFLIGFLRRDFGAAGLYALQRAGALDTVQTLVSLVTITLFVPCIAQYFMMVKERGVRAATAIAAFVTACALLTGGALERLLRLAGWS